MLGFHVRPVLTFVSKVDGCGLGIVGVYIVDHTTGDKLKAFPKWFILSVCKKIKQKLKTRTKLRGKNFCPKSRKELNFALLKELFHKIGNCHQIECNKNNSSKHSKREDILNNTVSTKRRHGWTKTC